MCGGGPYGAGRYGAVEGIPLHAVRGGDALRHFGQGTYALWDTSFSRGEEGICINGLIWMGDHDAMYRQIREKLEAGFRCVKLKIGAIGFEEELDLLRFIRRHFPAREVELRVDANGAFAPAEALDKLKRLAELDLHSIGGSHTAGQWDEMPDWCRFRPCRRFRRGADRTLQP